MAATEPAKKVKNADIEGVYDHVVEQQIEAIQGINARYQNQLQYQYYPEDYFTGADTTVYFGDVFLSDIMSLQFSLQENVRPTNGYASYTWDAVQRGSRLVQGAFTIAFTEAGYMYTVLDHISLLKERAKPRLAYLMGGEEVPNWIAGVKEDIEGLLYRHHGNANAATPESVTVTESTEQYLDEYEWDTLKHSLTKPMKDADYPNKAGRTRNGHLGQISQLQARLQELGFKWNEWMYESGGKKGKPIDFTVAKRPSTTHSDKSFKISPSVLTTYPPKAEHKDKWLLINRHKGKVNNQSIIGGKAYDVYNYWEAELQQRLDDYPGDLTGLYMGSVKGKYDGRYGIRTANGVNLFQDLAQVPAKDRAPNGNYLTVAVYEELKKGLKVNGVFDTPTMVAVKLFQLSKGLTPDGIVGPATRKALSPTATKTIKNENRQGGESLYEPEKMYQSRVNKYEQEVWGRVSSADDNHRRRTFFYHGHLVSDYLKENGFDIYITYGPTPEHVIGGAQKGQVPTELQYGEVRFNTTVKAIRNVQIQSVTQILDMSGEPIAEQYSFIAQDLD